MELTRQDMRNPRSAESTLASSHAGTRAALDPIDRTCTTWTVDSIDDFPFGDGLTAANDPSIERIFGNQLFLRGWFKGMENRSCRPSLLIMLVDSGAKFLGRDTGNILGNRRC